MVLLRKRKDLMSRVESGLQVFFAYRKQCLSFNRKSSRRELLGV